MCGTWLMMATALSCWSREMEMMRAPSALKVSCNFKNTSSWVSCSGHKIQYAPWNRSARAPPKPLTSEPAMG